MITRIANTTSPQRVRDMAEKYKNDLHPDISKFLQEYAECLEEETTENHICMFNLDMTHTCTVCGKYVKLAFPEIPRHRALTLVSG